MAKKENKSILSAEIYLDMTREEVKLIQQITREQMIDKARRVKTERENDHKCGCFSCVMGILESNLEDEKFYNDFRGK